MKQKMIALCLVLLLLCGCTQKLTQTSVKATTHSDITQPTDAAETASVPEATETEPAPVYDPTPAPCTATVTIDGAQLPSGSYGDAQSPLIRLQDLSQLVQAEIATTGGENGVYTCTLRAGDVSAVLSNGSTAAEIGGEAAELPCAPVYDGTDWYLPAQLLPQWLGYSEFNDAEQNHLYYTTLPSVEQIPDGYRVPILMYHAVSDNCWGISELFVSPSDMEAQLKYLTENGYTPIWFEDLPNVADYEKPVILTFDDGYDDNYTELFPLLQKYNVKATIFCIAGAFGTSHKMTAKQAKEMSDSGLVSIQSHTMTHPDLDKLGQEDLEYEIGQSKTELTRVTGKEPFVLCYPTGYYSGLSLEITEKYYSFGLLMGGGTYTTGDNRYLVYRQYVSRYTDIYSFAAMLGW